jgi:hypothetical protein
MLSAERLRELFEYDPANGLFRARVRRSNRQFIGWSPGSPNKKGYFRFCIDGILYYAHHLAWLYVFGYMPDEVDHRDTDHGNNRLRNLREATRTQNNANSKKPTTNTTGLKGAHITERPDRWTARVGVRGKTHCLGRFKSPEEAHAAYLAAAREHFGDFARGE